MIEDEMFKNFTDEREEGDGAIFLGEGNVLRVRNNV